MLRTLRATKREKAKRGEVVPAGSDLPFVETIRTGPIENDAFRGIARPSLCRSVERIPSAKDEIRVVVVEPVLRQVLDIEGHHSARTARACGRLRLVIVNNEISY